MREMSVADLFKDADEHRRRITFGDVERHIAQLAVHHHDCCCGRCPLVSKVSAQRVYAIASGWQRQSGRPEFALCAEPTSYNW
jgi:hypothetical protein